MGTISVPTLPASESDGSYARKDATVAFGASYNNTGNLATTGETLTAKSLGLAFIKSVITPSEEAGYSFDVLGLDDGPATSCRIQVFQGAAGTTGSTSGGTPAGTINTPTITLTAYTPTGTNSTSAVSGTGTYTDGATSGALNLASPAFNGTGYATAGQVITTTDNQTMTLNQCAGMWFIADALASTAPVLIVSNTAVTGAPAVLTVIGTAPATDAGTYKIVKNLTVGSVTALAGTAAAQTFTGDPSGQTASSNALTFTGAALAGHTHTIGAAAGGEVPNGTDLSTDLAAVKLIVSGW